MKIRNNTNKKLVFYFGNSYREEPTATIKLSIGDSINLENWPSEDISIQEG